MGAQNTLIQKTYEISIGQESLDIDFFGANKQFDWIELFLVYDKSDKHSSIHSRYNVEIAAKKMKPGKLTNFTEIYSLTTKQKYDIDNLMQQHLLFKQFVI